MDELVNMIAKKTGLSTEMSKTVVTMVLDFVKQKLPAPIASQVDAAIAGGGSSVASALGGLFGNK
jgi:nucleoid DNA-binding protein